MGGNPDTSASVHANARRAAAAAAAAAAGDSAVACLGCVSGSQMYLLRYLKVGTDVCLGCSDPHLLAAVKKSVHLARH
jgi:hypothetical protein